VTTKTAIDPRTLAAVQQFAERVRRDFPVKQVLLFGSRARGDHRSDSDVDVAFVLSGPKRRKMDVTLEMGELASDFLLEDGLFMTPLPIWEDEWENPVLASNPWLTRTIQAEGISL
jgi:uncharacterized protein